MKQAAIIVSAFVILAIATVGIVYVYHPKNNSSLQKNTTNTVLPSLTNTKNSNHSPVTPGKVPALYIATNNGVMWSAYNTTEIKYDQPKVFSDTLDVVKMNTSTDTVFLYAKDRVERRRHDGTLEATWLRKSSPTYQPPTVEETKNGSDKSGELQTGFLADGKLYLAANRSLIILDDHLQELGNLSPLSNQSFSKYKAIDDLFVNKSTAFLVDDIAYPLYVFSVDVSNPRQPKQLQKIGVGGVYGTITNQWYDDRSQDWCLQQSISSGYTGGHYTVICIAKSLYSTVGQTFEDGYLGVDVPGIKTIEVGTSDYSVDPGKHKGTGYAMLGDLNHHDDWTLIEEQNTGIDYIAGLGDTYKTEAKVNMGSELSFTKPFFYRYSGFVYLYALDTLNIFKDDGNTLTGLFTQTIPQIDIARTDGYQGTVKHPAWNSFAADPR